MCLPVVATSPLSSVRHRVRERALQESASIILAHATDCLVYAEAILTKPEIQCDPNDKLMQLLAAALAAALAFAGTSRKD